MRKTNSKTKPGQSQAEASKTKEATPPKEEAPKVEPPAVVEKPDPLKLAEAELLKDPNQYNKKPHPDEADYRRNQYLGVVKTKSHTSTVRYRDAAAIDSDKIKLYVNG